MSISLWVLRDALEIQTSRSVGIGVHTYCSSFSLLFGRKDVHNSRESEYLKS